MTTELINYVTIDICYQYVIISVAEAKTSLLVKHRSLAAKSNKRRLFLQATNFLLLFDVILSSLINS